jgi:hypothetical protein
MRRFTFCVAMLATMAVVGRSWAGLDMTSEAPQQPRLELVLVDGSRIIGVTGVQSVRMETSYAKMDVPLKQVLAIKVDENHETASLDLRNGDKLKGVINLEPMKLDTAFGKVSIGIEHIKEVRVTLTGGALPEALKRGLVLHYSFDRDEGVRVPDESGKENAGEVKGPKWTPKGKSGGACSFDGVDDYVVHSTRSLGPDGSPYSVSVWFKTTSIAPTTWFLLSGNSPSAYPRNAGDLFVTPEGSVHFGANDRDQRVHSKNGAAAVDTWCHVVGVANGKTRRLYVNGQLADVNLGQANDAQWHTDRLIGTRALPETFFSGLIDEVMIFDRALSDNEARQLYDVHK